MWNRNSASCHKRVVSEDLLVSFWKSGMTDQGSEATAFIMIF